MRKVTLPKLQLLDRVLLATRSISAQTRGNDPNLSEQMIECDQAVVESKVTIRPLEVVDRAAWQFGFNEILQIIAPVAKATADWKRQVHFIDQLIPGHQTVQQMPGIAKLDAMIDF